MKTQGEIQAAISERIASFGQEYIGRGPRAIHAHLIGDLLVIRLQGVLTTAELHLVKSGPTQSVGRNLLKQFRTHLVETARPLLETMIQEVTGTNVLSLHHDLSTVTGEEVLLFTLAEAPVCRQSRSNKVGSSLGTYKRVT
ncbi:conserved hypothetical protein [Pirellula staleyi DSM 6068]|uniref:Na+-translocating membrane potential-generating system MpsC domain-containing protein n=1 Tax=Pirellula staleyi (strain ATCC 27377 / DSM 6068 / ICPB 4128) TaxID=530564 RepID=D2R952_PIRSD|nr:DUF2294 domain-containing protein [Pirellula staleyi]ADB15879.1 conserved hypothetical protein [Pirellula staleyi DSM 6068]